MEAKDIKINHWYMIRQYGFTSNIKGKAVDICENYVTLKFYWGGIYRTRQIVELHRLIAECNKPSLFSNY